MIYQKTKKIHGLKILNRNMMNMTMTLTNFLKKKKNLTQVLPARDVILNMCIVINFVYSNF